MQSENNLKFIIFAMKEFVPHTPSLAQLKGLKIPGYVPPQKVSTANTIAI